MENNEQNQGGFTPSNAGQSQQPVFNNQPQEEGGKGFAIAGMVLGILSIVCCCLGWIAVIMGVIGIVLSILAIVQQKPGKNMAIAGVICSAIGIIIFIVLMVIGTSVDPNSLMQQMENMQ